MAISDDHNLIEDRGKDQIVSEYVYDRSERFYIDSGLRPEYHISSLFVTLRSDFRLLLQYLVHELFRFFELCLGAHADYSGRRFDKLDINPQLFEYSLKTGKRFDTYIYDTITLWSRLNGF